MDKNKTGIEQVEIETIKLYCKKLKEKYNKEALEFYLITFKEELFKK